MKLFFLILAVPTILFATDVQRSAAEPEDRAYCDVNLLGGLNVTGGRCRFFDEVMTGIVSTDPLTVRCSRIRVTCNRQGNPLEVKLEKETSADETN